MTDKIVNEGGRPPLVPGEKAKTMTISVPREMVEQWERDVVRFANGNRSEMFRLMYKAWRAEVERLLGKVAG